MSSEDPLVITPTTELDTARVPDQAIAKINRSFNRFYQERRQEVVEALRQLPSILMVLDELTSGTSYEALVSPEVVKEVQAGAATWDQYADGFYGAVIRDTETGQIVCHVKLREVTPDLLSSLNQLAVQRTLAEIVQKLEAIDQKVTTVLQGQRNDRLAIIESGIQLYEQAMAAANSQTRHELLIQAVDKLNEGRQQLILSMESEMRSLDDQLPRSSLDSVLRAIRKNVHREIQERAQPIQESLQAIVRASYVLACAYQALDEPESLNVSLHPLEETLLEVGTMGEKIARYLPYDVEYPPEDLWHSGPLELADGVAVTGRELEYLPSKTIALGFYGRELITGGSDVRASMQE